MKNFILALVAVLIGFGLGLAYSWLIAPVKYVDASPVLLRADFKDQYRIVIAASYASSHDLARARARLELLSATDPLGELKAQAQRMVGYSESPESVQLLVQLASDLEKGVVSIPLTSTPFATSTHPPMTSTASTKAAMPTPTPEPIKLTAAATPTALGLDQLPLTLPALTITPRPTFTSAPMVGVPFVLVAQDPVCDPGIQPGLLQFTLADARRRQLAGIEIIVISVEGEDHFFTGFKPEVGDGYADFVMQANTSYSVRIGEGGAFVTNISAPACTDPNGVAYLGGLKMAFQQP